MHSLTETEPTSVTTKGKTRRKVRHKSLPHTPRTPAAWLPSNPHMTHMHWRHCFPQTSPAPCFGAAGTHRSTASTQWSPVWWCDRLPATRTEHGGVQCSLQGYCCCQPVHRAQPDKAQALSVSRSSGLQCTTHQTFPQHTPFRPLPTAASTTSTGSCRHPTNTHASVAQGQPSARKHTPGAVDPAAQALSALTAFPLSRGATASSRPCHGLQCRPRPSCLLTDAASLPKSTHWQRSGCA